MPYSRCYIYELRASLGMVNLGRHTSYQNGERACDCFELPTIGHGAVVGEPLFLLRQSTSSEGDMPIENCPSNGENNSPFLGLSWLDWTIKDPSKRLDFSPENADFARQPPQANRYIRWLYASSQAALDSLWSVLSHLPIELCRQSDLNYERFGRIEKSLCRPQTPLM
jgi:hypothetical protein